MKNKNESGVSNRAIGSLRKSSSEWPGTAWPRTVMREGWKRVGARPNEGLTRRPYPEK